jgi:hypothetical protein
MSEPHSRIPADSAEATRDLQDRLVRFAGTTFVISGVMLVASVVTDLVTGIGWAGLSHASRTFHVAAQALLGLVWLLCRGKSLRVPVIEALDAALTIVLCTTWAALGFAVPESEPIQSTILLASTYTVIMRSVVVPSAFSRTLWISGVSMLPTAAFFAKREMAFIPGAAPERVRTFLVFSLLWCAVAVFVAAMNSRQLFGLRQRIREVGRLGQYTLVEKIGEGGMGVVYRAKHAMLRRPAAIKLLLAGRASEKDVVRFEREVQLTSLLAHPNTISIFDFGRTAEGAFYYVMEYLDGFDLELLIQEEGPIESGRVLRILAQVSGALSEAHGLGLIHRDIKPANIILTERIDQPDVVKVVDFGLVRTLEHATSDPTITTTNAITGTPMYLAPEAISAPDSVDGRSDLYALGCVGYFLLTGKPVFESASVVEVLSKHLLEAPVPPSKRLGRPVSADLEALILACLAKAPEQRPASASALRDALLACSDVASVDNAALQRWWRERGTELRRRTKPAPSERPATMAIDLRGREARGA